MNKVGPISPRTFNSSTTIKSKTSPSNKLHHQSSKQKLLSPFQLSSLPTQKHTKKNEGQLRHSIPQCSRGANDSPNSARRSRGCGDVQPSTAKPMRSCDNFVEPAFEALLPKDTAAEALLVWVHEEPYSQEVRRHPKCSQGRYSVQVSIPKVRNLKWTTSLVFITYMCMCLVCDRTSCVGRVLVFKFDNVYFELG